MKNNTPISEVIAQLQNLSDPAKAKELIKQFSAGLKESGIDVPDTVYDMPEEMDRIFKDPTLSVKVGEQLEKLAAQIKGNPGTIQEQMNVMFKEMTNDIDELDPEVTAGIQENAKASATRHIQEALKNIQIGRK